MSGRAVVAVVLLLTGIVAGCASERRRTALALGYADGVIGYGHETAIPTDENIPDVVGSCPGRR